MTRIHTHASRRTHAQDVLNNTATAHRPRPSKPRFLVRTELHKRLKTTHVVGWQAPDGWSFLALGSRKLAATAKELSRQRDIVVRIVSDYGSQTDPTALNPYVNRIGYHFEGNLFKEACDMCGYRVVGDELIPPANQAATFDAFDVSTDSSGGDAKGTERMRALAYMEELFPKMPVEEREECYEHAWEAGKVGHAPYTIGKRVQLAVVARIRHHYTAYDKLLHGPYETLRTNIHATRSNRNENWRLARKMVQQNTIAKVLQWRGENSLHDDVTSAETREILELIDSDSENEYEPVDDSADGLTVQVRRRGGKTDPIVINDDDGDALMDLLDSVDKMNETGHAPIARESELRDNRADAIPPQYAQTITVPLDSAGRAPRTIVHNGVKLTRRSSSPDVLRSIPAAAALTGANAAVTATTAAAAGTTLSGHPPNGIANLPQSFPRFHIGGSHLHQPTNVMTTKVMTTIEGSQAASNDQTQTRPWRPWHDPYGKAEPDVTRDVLSGIKYIQNPDTSPPDHLFITDDGSALLTHDQTNADPAVGTIVAPVRWTPMQPSGQGPSGYFAMATAQSAGSTGGAYHPSYQQPPHAQHPLPGSWRRPSDTKEPRAQPPPAQYTNQQRPAPQQLYPHQLFAQKTPSGHETATPGVSMLNARVFGPPQGPAH